MSIRITGNTVVAKKSAIEAHFRGGLAAYEAAAPAAVRKDDELIAVAFEDGAAAESWMKRLTLNGVTDVAHVDPASPIPRGWLDVREGEAMLRVPVRRFDVLSKSDSGLHYVREKRGGILRVLTESEIADFDDPPPCPQCAEQFGCEHYNCAGEELFAEVEIAGEVPPQWTSFARDYGLSRNDLVRLTGIDQTNEGEYRATGVNTDMRTLELVLLLNDAR